MLKSKEQDNPFISIIAPAYNEEGNIMKFYERTSQVLSSLTNNYEIIFINDGSSDDTMLILARLADEDKKVKVISFSKNFGHQVAVSAGLDHANGDAVVIIDTDLQDPPEVISDMLISWRKGYEVINARRRTRKDSFLKVLTAKMFYRLLNVLVSNDIPEDVGDFRMLDRKAVNALRLIKEKERYIRGLTNWIGFEQSFVLYDRDERLSGKTHYPVRKMIQLALTAIFSFSSFPLKLANLLAFIFLVIGAGVVGYALAVDFMGETIPGWTSQVLINLSFSITQLFVLGIISEYIGRIHKQVQDRPMYIISDIINIEN